MARDPYKYFRVEARELLDGLGRGVLELEKGAGGVELVVQLLRLAHTLKGASRVVRQPRIAELAHAIEDILTPHREGQGAVQKRIDELLRLLDQISSSVAALGPAAASGAQGPGSPGAEPLTNVRVEVEEVDALLEGVFETNVRLAAMRRDLSDLARARSLIAVLVELSPRASRARLVVEELSTIMTKVERNLHTGLDHVDREAGQVRDKADRLRLMPAATVFASLELGARDVAQSLNKAVRFETSGGDHRLEANVLLALRDALLHVVRNAVAHGIEPETERQRLGKSLVGLVRLDVERRGSKMAFVCRDDGRGIDVEGVRRAAVARGVATATEAAALGVEQVLRLVLEGGVTTTEKVTEVSGRGIGLDVLRTTVAQLQGDVGLISEAGRGTTVDVCVPLSISSVAALAVDVSGVTASMPFDSVRCILRLAASDIARSPDFDSVIVDGVVMPFLPLAMALGLRLPRQASTRPWNAVVVQSGSRVAAIGVDRLVGRPNVVLRPLPKLAGPAPLVAGASLDSEGNPQLVLDPRALVDVAHAPRGIRIAPTSGEAARSPVLIIDDSLTTRMLEQSILESAGYSVDLAVSAEEALTKARQSPYSLFLVDVEMPGMDGFEFVSKARADPALGAIPAILVTSRDSARDRRRGEEVGARAYIVKGEFDQGHLLQVIGQLIG